MLWLVKIWQVSSCVKFMQHILKVVYFDSWSWHSFESTCDVFNCLFPLNVQNEIQLLSRVFSYSLLVCLLGFCWEMRRLSKPIIRFRMASFLFYILLDAYENHKGSSDPCLTRWLSGAASWNMVSPSNYKQLLDEVFVISGIIKVEVSVAEADNTNRDLDYSRHYKNRI